MLKSHCRGMSLPGLPFNSSTSICKNPSLLLATRRNTRLFKSLSRPITLSPFVTNSSTSALPIPELAPVMRAILFNREVMLRFCVLAVLCDVHEKILLTAAGSFCMPISVLDTSLYCAENVALD